MDLASTLLYNHTYWLCLALAQADPSRQTQYQELYDSTTAENMDRLSKELGEECHTTPKNLTEAISNGVFELYNLLIQRINLKKDIQAADFNDNLPVLLGEAAKARAYIIAHHSEDGAMAALEVINLTYKPPLPRVGGSAS